MIASARQAGVTVYTIGVGRPAKRELLSTVLVLDPAAGTYQALSRTTEPALARPVVEAARSFLAPLRFQRE